MGAAWPAGREFISGRPVGGFRTMQTTSELRDAIWQQGELLNELTFHARLLNARPGDFDVVTLMLASVVEVNEQYERITRLISSQSN